MHTCDCSAEMPVPDDAPVMVAWNEYRKTPGYANTRHWAQRAENVDGSLWSAFEHGFRAAQNGKDCDDFMKEGADGGN